MRADIAIIGGSVGGCAAALAAVRQGMTVILTEETDWIGGQLTSQAVPPDEHQWIETHGCTKLYRQFREAVREYYRRNFPLSATARKNARLNPGGGTVSRLTHEPRVALAVLEAMLAPAISGGQLTVLLKHRAVAADVEGNSVRSVEVESAESGGRVQIDALYFLDATEQGDLLPLTKTEYVTGCESRRDTGEAHAPEQAQPANLQSCTVCFAMDYIEGEDHTIDRPREYAFWRDYTPALRPAWGSRLLDYSSPDPRTLKPRKLRFDPRQRVPVKRKPANLWLYRRIRTQNHYEPGTEGTDISLVNWPQNDYWLGNLHDVPAEEVERNLERAKQLSLSLLYWLQTEAPGPDGKAGWRGLRLRPDQMGTKDGLAKYPYIRESRRIRAEFTVVEQHVATDSRVQLTGLKPNRVTAETFPDSVGVGSYRIDLHPSTGGDHYIDIASLPFQIPLGSLIPVRMQNLLPACKNLGVTHITNGCYRLHPVEWNIGESAGALAAHSIRTRQRPREIRNVEKRRRDFQEVLMAQGVELAWPADTVNKR